jgi:IS30 family transposase
MNGCLPTRVSLAARRVQFYLRLCRYAFSELLGKAVIELLQPLADRVLTLTSDNGKEFAEHEHIAQDLGIDFFFAHPYAAWERGANENMNGLVRQYIPKDRELASVTIDELDQITHRLNHRPRKCLDFKSPFEVFFGQPVALTS